MTGESAAFAPPAARRPRVLAARTLGLVAGVAAFAWVLHYSGASLSALALISPVWIAAIFGVSLGVYVADTLPWRAALKPSADDPHVRPGLTALTALRLTGEALTNVLPGGVVLAETFKARLLSSRWAVTFAHAASAVLLVRFGLGLSQAVYVLVGIAVAPFRLGTFSAQTGAVDVVLYSVAAAVTVGMAVIFSLPLVLMARGSTFSAAARVLRRLPLLERWLTAHAATITQLDRRAQALFAARRRLLLVFVLLVLGWFANGVESWVILRALGSEVPLIDAIAVDALGSIFKLVFFFVPAGLGGQDVSLLVLLDNIGIEDATAGNFVLLRRLKEAFWTGIGLAALPFWRRR